MSAADSTSGDLFITEDFLLETEIARRLYHDYAANLPIIDYHCHLPPEEIAKDRRFDNLTQVWLAGDHYKWRAMRANGVAERFCTGDASDWEKFSQWAATVPKLLRNPLYHWTHMELKRPFGIADRLLCPETAQGIWDECQEKLGQSDFTCRGLMKQMNVVHVCTTDDPTDSLEHHQAIAEDSSLDVHVLPAWRPDRAMDIDDPEALNDWVNKLAKVADVDIRDFDSYLSALRGRHDYFASRGCRLSDHGLETMVAADYTQPDIDRSFSKLRKGQSLNAEESLKFKSAMLYEMAIMDHEKGWVQQYHLGALRNCNTRLISQIGGDSGFDSIGDFEMARPMVRFFDRLDQTNQLARTILYNLNPRDNVLFATMVGNFQDGSTAGKMQYGSAWWFLDQIDGMTRQIEALSNMGLLSRFIGMLTDSRSFLSYPRHEYFRRLLCNLLAEDIRKGLIPHDLDMIGSMVKDIGYRNAANYFELDVPQID